MTRAMPLYMMENLLPRYIGTQVLSGRILFSKYIMRIYEFGTICLLESSEAAVSGAVGGFSGTVACSVDPTATQTRPPSSSVQ